MNTKRIENEIEQPIRKASIPNGWSTYTLYEVRDKSDRYSFTGGPFGSDLKTEDYTDEGVRIIQLQNIGDGKFLDDYKVYTSKEKADQLLSCNIYPGEIIIAKMAEPLARACIIPNDNNRYLMASDGIRLKIDTERFDTYFILNMINSWFFRKEAIKKGTGTTRLRIGLSDLKNIKIIAPSLQEQKAISKIITVWDKAIELKEKLIEQKKEQKKGLMQKLLTGEVRLPGFEGEWKEVRLGSILKERKETGFEQLELLAITSQKGVVKRKEIDIKDTSSEDKSKYKRILPRDIGYNTMRMWQGVSGVSKYEGIVSPAYTILKPTEKIDSDFIGYLFKFPKVINLFKRYSQGLVSDTLSLKYENLEIIKVFIPIDIYEQKMIANVLLCIDKEISTLQKEVELLKQQKKGLMQLLLTGKVRVKV